MEELVIAETRHDEEFCEICRHRLDSIYELPEEERREVFTTTYSTLFEEHQLGKQLNPLLTEFLTLQNLEEVLVYFTKRPIVSGLRYHQFLHEPGFPSYFHGLISSQSWQGDRISSNSNKDGSGASGLASFPRGLG